MHAAKEVERAGTRLSLTGSWSRQISGPFTGLSELHIHLLLGTSLSLNTDKAAGV